MAFTAPCGHEHNSVDEARKCTENWTASDKLTNDPFGEFVYDRLIQEREREQDEAAAQYKMARYEKQVFQYAEGDIRNEVAGYNPDTGEMTLQDRRPEDPQEDIGFYKHPGGDIYKVQANGAKTAVYAKRLVNADEAGTGAKLEWEYERGAIFDLRMSMRMDPEAVGDLGKLFGWCTNCGKDISREESLYRGYGPDCAKKYGWPYDHSRK